MAAEINSNETAETPEPARKRPARTRKARSSVKPMRTITIFAAVTALVATAALPAFSAITPSPAEATTLQQMALDDAQSLVVASDATEAPLDRGTYAATTPEEIEKKKAEEEAKKRAAAAAAAAASSGGVTDFNTAGYALVAPGSGEVRYPVPHGSYYVSRTLGNGHNGADMVAPAGTPIYAATGGVVRISSESHWGYGVAVVIDSVVGGQRVSTLYAHMINGSRQVGVGQSVAPGQLIGYVGNTGRSFGAHLHFEVQVNGSLVEPMGWLQANAG